MPNPRKPFRLNVGFIIHEEVGYTHEIPFDFDKANLGDDLELTQFTGSVHIGRTPQGLVVQGKFSGETGLECVRCLKAFARPLSWELTELYAFNKKSVSESGLILAEDAHIDLQPLLRECIPERLHHMVLAHHLAECPGPVFAGEHEVRHAPDSTGCSARALAPAYNNG